MDATQIASISPRLDAADERELARLIEAGVFAGHALEQDQSPCGASAEELRQVVAHGELAWQKFFEGNISLVRCVVARWVPVTHPDSEDLVHEGCMGLVEAIMRFDHALGWRFSTLAWYLVSQQVAIAAVGNRSCGSGTVAHARRVARIERARSRASASRGAPVSDREVADLVGRSVEAVRRDLGQARRVEADQDILEQTIPDERPVHDVSFLSELADQERRVLELNFGIRNGRAQTLVQIAEHMGMSVSAVSRLKQRALRRGRALVHAEIAA